MKIQASAISLVTMIVPVVSVTGNKYAIVVTGDDYGRSLINYLGSGTDRFDEKGKEIKQILESQYELACHQ